MPPVAWVWEPGGESSEAPANCALVIWVLCVGVREPASTSERERFDSGEDAICESPSGSVGHVSWVSLGLQALLWIVGYEVVSNAGDDRREVMYAIGVQTCGHDDY